MRKLLLLNLLLFTGFFSFGQTTYTASYSQNGGYPAGIRPSTSSTTETTGWAAVLGTSSTSIAANTWSPVQTIPFTFDFFGQPVTQFKASANMLLTFDVAATALPSVNDNLPSANLPDKTIAGFWDEFTNAAPTGSGDRVMSKVFGTAPNRQLWVVWYSFEYGNPNISFAYNAIVLEETTNKVYVVDLYNNGSPALTTTVGVQLNSTTAVQAGTNQLNLGPNTSASVADVDYYTFAPRPVVALDAAATALITPLSQGCYTATQPIEITITNFGTSTLTSVPVAASVTGVGAPQLITGTYTGSIAPNASANVVIGNANMSASGTYSIKAYTNLTGDGFRGNDTLGIRTFTVAPIVTLPQIVDFTGFTGANLATISPGWFEANGTTPTGTTSTWVSDDFGNVPGGANEIAARINLDAASDNVWIISPKITATPTTSLKFDLALTVAGTTTGAILGTDDQVKVMVSTDCGVTFTTVQTYSATTPISNTGQTETISLAAYAGQNIIVAIYATEGTVNDPENNDLFVDNIFLGTPPAIDLGAGIVSAPVGLGCYTASEPVTITIQNFGTIPINFATTPATVTVNVTGAVTQTLTSVVNTGTLAPGATLTVTAGNLNMTTAGTYTFAGGVTIAGDGNATNDSFVTTTRSVTALAALPQTVDFTGFTGTNLTTVFPNWREATGLTTPAGTTSSWINDDFRNVVAQPNGVAARINLYTLGKNDWIVGPKVTATSSTVLKYDLALTTYAGTAATTLGSDDVLKVMVSTDCGATFTAIRTYSNTTPISNTGQSELINLGSYAGQDIIVAFFASEGTVDDIPDNDLFIDNVFLGTPPSLDMGATALVSPATTGCYTATEPVTVTIQNFGPNTMNFATNPVTVTVNVTGAVTQTLTTTVNTGTIASGATQNVVAGNLNMTTAGTYTFNASTTLTGDGNPANDALPAVSRTVTALATLPQTVDFTGFNGTNLNTLFPNWKEAAGTTPLGTTSSWTNDDFGNVVGGSNGVSAKINLYTTGKNDWIVGPRVLASASTVLKYDLALTIWNGTASTNLGSDDVVRIMVSTNCGLTYTPIRTYDANSTISNTGQAEVVSLGSYAGQEIIVAFFASEGTVDDAPDNDIFIDNIFLGTPPAIDMAATALLTPVSGGCYGATESVSVRVQNLGVNPINFATTPTTVTVNVTGAVTQTLTTTLNTGTLAPLATQDVTVGTLNMSTAGTYTLNGGTSVTGDGNTANDNFPQVTIVNGIIATFPYLQNFENFPASGAAAGNFGWTGQTTGLRWETEDGPTASLDTGPDVDHTTGAAGGKYVFLETSSGSTGNTAEFVSPCINLAGQTNMAMQFWYHMYGATIDTLKVQVLNGANWVNVFSIGGQQQVSGTDPWQSATVSLAAYSGNTIKVRFIGKRGNSFTGDIAIDDVSFFQQLAAPTVTATGATTFCTGGSVTLTASTTLANPSFQWFNNGTAITGATSATYIATTAGSYTATVTSGSNTSAPSTATTVTVNAAAATPTITTAGATTICTGGSVTLTASSATTGATFQWFNNGTAITGATSATYTASAAGSYTVVASANGCSSVASSATTVTVTNKPAAPTITVAGGGSTTICQGASVSLTGASATAGVAYRWSRNGAPIAGATSASYTATLAGNYRVIASLGSCSDSSAVTAITVNPKPATPTITKTGNMLTSSATTGTYQWFSVSGSTLTAVTGATSQNFTPVANGNYTVVVTVNGCSSDAATTMNVVLGIASLAPGMDVSIYPNPTAGKFEVKLTGFEKEAMVQIISVTGQVIAAERVAITSDKMSKAFDLGGMAKGVYILKVTSGNNLTFRKVILD